MNPFEKHCTEIYIRIQKADGVMPIQYLESLHFVPKLFVRIADLQDCIAAIFLMHGGDIIVRELKRGILNFKMP